MSQEVKTIYERSLQQLTGSYKLWYNYLKMVRTNTKKCSPSNPIYEEANNAHERALIHMHKMPRIWIDYLSFLKFQGFITQFRRTFDRCLRSLPSTQHKRIWTIGLEFVNLHCDSVPETALRMYRRYVELAPEETEDFVEFLIEQQRMDEASQKLVDILNNEHFGSKYSKTKFELWQKLCEIITKNPQKIQSVNVDAILRQGISRYKDQVGVLWNCLADYYIRSNNFGHAKDIYEEAMSSVETVADFKLIFDAYSDFYQTIIKRKIELLVEEFNDALEIDLNMETEKYEDLINRRALLINSVHLKQNPHNVHHWLERVKLYEDSGAKAQFETFQEAISKIEVDKVTGGRLSQLWKEMAWLYVRFERVADAREVFQQAVKQRFDKVDDLADIYCAWAEMEIKLDNVAASVAILRGATTLPGKRVNYQDKSLPVQQRIHKSLKVWSLLVDLVTSVGSVEDATAMYDAIVELHIATPQIVLNYAKLLEENRHFEKAFSVYQKGVAMFRWPIVYDIWLSYISRFVERYESRHFERGNELFESCLEACPAELATEFYLMHARYVEQYGLAKKSLQIYEKAAIAAPAARQFELFLLFIDKVRAACGIAATRAIYQSAIERLNDGDTKRMCIRFAEMETQLGEVDRARMIYSHCSQFCDPRITEVEFWDKWRDFETRFGNTENLADMNLVKRSVETKYNTQQNVMNVHLSKSRAAAAGGAGGLEDCMQSLEASLQKVPNPIAFVSGGTSGAMRDGGENPEVLDVDMGEDEDERDEEMAEEEDEEFPKELPIPDEVFGSLLRRQ